MPLPNTHTPSPARTPIVPPPLPRAHTQHSPQAACDEMRPAESLGVSKPAPRSLRVLGGAGRGAGLLGGVVGGVVVEVGISSASATPNPPRLPATHASSGKPHRKRHGLRIQLYLVYSTHASAGLPSRALWANVKQNIESQKPSQLSGFSRSA